MKKETLADRLNEAMNLAGMSRALAKASGIAQPTIWRLVSGNARINKIVEIANALGVRSEWLSTGNGPMRDDGQLPRAARVKVRILMHSGLMCWTLWLVPVRAS